MKTILIYTDDLPLNSLGYLDYDSDTQIVTATVPTKVVSLDVNYQNVFIDHENLGLTHFEINSRYINSYEENPDQNPCCTWFSPSATHVSKDNAEQISNYPFFRNRKNGQCFNPRITNSRDGFVQCGYYNHMAGMVSCSEYNASEYFTHIIGILNDEDVFIIEKRFVGMRKPLYRIVDSKTKEVLFEGLTSFDSELSILSLEYDGVAIQYMKPEVKSYLKSVLV